MAYSSIPSRKATTFRLRARPGVCCAPETRRPSFPAKQTDCHVVAHAQRVVTIQFVLISLMSHLIGHYDLEAHHLLDYLLKPSLRAFLAIMASETRVKSRHPWSLMNEEELTCKLQNLG